jgi:hypothetical protein
VETKTFQRLVIPVIEAGRFKRHAFHSFEFSTSQFSSYWYVKDHPKQQLLTIHGSPAISVPPNAPGILARLNEINEECAGKFTLVEQKHLRYYLELPYTTETTQAMFQHALNLALDTMVTQYEGWLKAANEAEANEFGKELGLFDRIRDAVG